jgi:putative ABC transport system permease protein
MVTHRRARFAVSLLGIAFAVVIMFMEIGFSNGINDSQARLAAYLDADLVLIHRRRYALVTDDEFSLSRLQQTIGLSEIVSATPLYEGTQVILNPATGMVRGISVIAFPPGTTPLKLAGLDALSLRLVRRDAVLYDRLSRELYGPVKVGTRLQLGAEAEEHTVVGLFELGPTIRSDGLLLMGDGSWRKSKEAADSLTMGLLKVRPGTDLRALKAQLTARIGDEVLIMTPEELRVREVDFIAHATPAGTIFVIGLIVGVAIGVIICYQILFNEISDNLPQYATVKAMGFPPGYLVGLVMRQALLLGLFGFIPGLAGGALLYSVIQHSTRILMLLTWQRIVFIFALTILMCAVSGLLAVRKVLRADPAEVF